MDDISKRFVDLIEQNEGYQEALQVVQNNSSGGIWLIGGAVYRTLMFGDCEQAKDFDFIADIVSRDEELFVPAKYWVGRNRFNGLKFVASDIEIDLAALSDVYHICKKRVGVTIENYMKYVPFNIHSIVWDVTEQKIMGDVGIGAMEERILRVNDLEMAEDMAERYGMSVRSALEKKAMELDFDYEVPI